MSHEFDSGLYRETPAWHRLGRVFAPGAPEVRDPDRARGAAGLSWEPAAQPVFNAAGAPLDGYRAWHRDDNGTLLHVARETWTPLFNRDFVSWFRPFLDAGCEFESLGALKEGRLVWGLLRTPLEAGAVDLQGRDSVRPYLLACNSHDGTRRWACQFTPIRVVCWNTLSQTFGTEAVRVRHTRRISEAVKLVRETIDMARQEFSVTVEQYRRMRRATLGISGLRDYVRAVLEVPADQEEFRAWEPISTSFIRGPGSDLAGDTVWGAYNAVTDWIGHERGRSPESRLESAWFGAGRETASRAHALALQLSN